METLKPCPFCGGTANIVISDDEGNLREPEYEKDQRSGLSFKIQHTHEENEGCPIATYECDDATMGVYLYDSREEAAAAWDKRNYS